jgi:ComF family protein
MGSENLKTPLTVRVANALKCAIFPEKCLMCGVLFHPLSSQKILWEQESKTIQRITSSFLCNTCSTGTEPIRSPICSVCGIMFKTRQGEDHVCGHCIEQSWHFKAARAFCVYHGDIRTLIHSLKFKGKIQVAEPLSKLLFSACIRFWNMNSIDLVVPVPLHIKRFRQRGFNQAFLLVRDWIRFAEDLNKAQFRIRIGTNLLLRNRHTKPQIGLGKEDRISNIKNAFRVCDPGKIKGKRILLIDDVFTTGATVDECAKTLIKTGAVRVDVLTLARVMSLR